MAQRLRFYDCRVSRLPSAIGLCQGDNNRLAQYINAAQQRLLMCKEAGEEGWYGGWAEVAFTVSQTQPFVTFTPDVARLEFVDVCTRPVSVANQFVEYLRFGNGRLPKLFQAQHPRCMSGSVLTRNNSPTFTDLSNAPQFVTVFMGNADDAGKRILIQGTDQNGITIYSQDGASNVTGQFLSMASPMVSTPQTFSSITGIQKDITLGQVQVFQTDPTTGVQVLLVTMQPWETTAWYRRYYFDRLPFNCCTPTVSASCPTQPTTTSSVSITAIVKLDLIPVSFDTDYLLIQNLEAITQECQAIRYSTMDSTQSRQLEAICHKNAVRQLNGEINHFLGTDDPAINVAVFGSARLEKQGIGTMI